MKKFFTLALGLVLFASCSSDDNGGNTVETSNLTNKKWVAISFIIEGQTIPADIDFPECERDYIMFKPDGVFTNAYYTSECEEVIDNGSWVLEGNTITTNEDGEITVATIKKLTATEFEVDTQQDIDFDGQLEMITLVMTSN